MSSTLLRTGWLPCVLGLALAATAACTDDDGDGGAGGTSSSSGVGGSTSSSGSGGTTSSSSSGVGGDIDPATPFPDDTHAVLLHHSTGGVIWGGGVSDWIGTYNSAGGKSYTVTERAYPDTPYPWQNYPYDYWYLWVDSGGSPVQSQDTLEILTQQHEVIVFKHCFPVSGIVADSGTPDVSSDVKSIENYQLQYAALKDKLHSFPQNRFLVWTGAALIEAETNADQGARSRQFFQWVKETWDEPGDNIYVWDFFELETEGGLYLLDGYSAGDSHPSDAFAQQVAPLFAQRLVDVIEGRGDTGSLTGE